MRLDNHERIGDAFHSLTNEEDFHFEVAIKLFQNFDGHRILFLHRHPS